MPPRKDHSEAMMVAREAVLERCRVSSESEEPSQTSTPVYRQLIFPNSTSPDTIGSDRGSNSSLSRTTTTENTTTKEAIDIRLLRRKRKHDAEVARDTQVEGSSQQKKKNGGRGIFTGKALEKQMRDNNNQRIPLSWNYKKKILCCEHSNRVANFIGAIVREDIPMTKLSYFDHDSDVFKIVIDRLSTVYQFDWGEDNSLYDHIQQSASNKYGKWKNECKDAFEIQKGREPVPINFRHRPHEWHFLCDYFETEGFKKKSKEMRDTRFAENRVEHRSGPIPFLVRAGDHADKGHIAPFVQTLVDVTRSEEIADRGRALISQAEKEKELSISDGTTETAQSCTIEQLPLEKQISMIDSMRGRGKSVGTVVHGMGSTSIRNERQRGPAKGIERSSIVEDKITELKKKHEDDMLAIQRKSDEQGKLIAHLYELIKGRGLNIEDDIPPPN